MTMDKYEERKRIGARIAELRTSKGMTQEELAEASGLQQSNLARVESGRYSTRLDTLAAIAAALGYTVDFIRRDGN